jgi:predicted regulator of amino acid metabolism with ACT domain
MFVEVHDLITGQYYSIGKQSICYFTKEINEAGCNVYYIVLNDKTKISVTVEVVSKKPIQSIYKKIEKLEGVDSISIQGINE